MDFKELKRKKERGQTNKEFLDMVFEDVKDFEQLTVTVQYPSGVISTWYSQESTLGVIGALEVAKNQILEDMRS